MDFDWSALPALLCIVGFVGIRRWRLGNDFTRSEAIKMAILGTSFPAVIILIVGAFFKEVLTSVTDIPSYLLLIGVILGFYSIGDLFDWKH